MSQPKFCDQCGAALNPGARFCSTCGQPVRPLPTAPQPGSAAESMQPAAQPPPVQLSPVPRPAPTAPPTTPQPAPGGERVLGVIAGAQRRKGLLGFQTFSVIVTPARLVFAETTSQMQKDAVREAAEEAKREGKGLLGRMAAQWGWLNRIVDKYQAMPVEAALRETRDNFFILNAHVRKVSVQEKRDMETHQRSYHLVIEASSGKYGFELKAGGPDEARQLLRQTLGAAVR